MLLEQHWLATTRTFTIIAYQSMMQQKQLQHEREETMATATAPTILRKNRLRRPASVDDTITRAIAPSSSSGCRSEARISTHCNISSQRLSNDSRTTAAYAINVRRRKKQQHTTKTRRRRMCIPSLDGSAAALILSSTGSTSSSFRFGRIFVFGIMLVTLVQAQDGEVPFFSEPTAPMAPTPAPVPSPTNAPVAPPPPPPPPPPTDNPVAPTDPPTKAPTTDAPTKNPTQAPVTPQPTDNPTRAPVTQQPSDLPSMQPSLVPTRLPSLSPSRVPTLFPTKSQTPTSVTPAPTISPAPTTTPSQSPSMVPTLMPSLTPSRQPTAMPSFTPSQHPSSAPTLQPQSQLVNVVMRLENTYGRLSGGAEFDFQAASEFHLRQEIENSVQPPGLVKLIDIQCQIYGQTVVNPRPPEETKNSNSNRNSLRNLQSQQPLRVGFNAFIKFQSEADENIVSDWVGECFNSVSKRQAYMDRLKRANPAAFNIVTDVMVLVEGEKPEEEVPPPPIIGPDGGGSGASTVWILIAALAGGVLVAFFVGILVYNRHKSKQRQEELAMQSDYSKQQQQHGDSYHNESATSEGQQFAAEIRVERQDDISTLGDPVGLAGMNMATGAHGEDRTASVASNYDYALQFLGGGTMQGRSRLESGGEDSDAFEVSHNSSSALNIHGPGGLAATHAVFADDASFDEVFDPRDKDSDYDVDDDENITGNGNKGNGKSNNKTVKHVKFRVDVPRGKLGMVIDTPNGGAPVVHAMKPDSVLADRLQPGDYLVEFDGRDVRKLSAVAVSQLISEKSDKERVMYFVRRVVVDATTGDDTVGGESRAC